MEMPEHVDLTAPIGDLAGGFQGACTYTVTDPCIQQPRRSDTRATKDDYEILFLSTFSHFIFSYLLFL